MQLNTPDLDRRLWRDSSRWGIINRKRGRPTPDPEKLKTVANDLNVTRILVNIARLNDKHNPPPMTEENIQEIVEMLRKVGK